MTLLQPEPELPLESAKSFPRILFSVLFSFQIAKLTLQVSVSLDSRHLSKRFQAFFHKPQAGTPGNTVPWQNGVLLVLELQTSLDFQGKYYKKVKSYWAQQLPMKLLRAAGLLRWVKQVGTSGGENTLPRRDPARRLMKAVKSSHCAWLIALQWLNKDTENN